MGQTLAVNLCIEAGIPVILRGKPGIGKTAFLRAIAETTDRHLETVIASVREPADFAGLPVVTNGRVTLAPPHWAHAVAEAPRALLFLDEFSTAAPSVQGAALRVVHERIVGDFALPDTVSIVAAMNEERDAAGGYLLAPPMANRFVHIDWAIDNSDWAMGLVAGFEVGRTVKLPQDWRKTEVFWRSRVAAFIKARPTSLHTMPKDEIAQGQAWASPRTWAEMFVPLNAACDAVGADESTRLLLASGCVGAAAAAEFYAYNNSLDLPDPETLLKDPSKYVPQQRTDHTFAVATSVVAAVAHKLTNERYGAAWAVMAQIAKHSHKDGAVVGAKQLVTIRKSHQELTIPPDQAKVFAATLKAAGVLA
jgi:MoxR-like ATPase